MDSLNLNFTNFSYSQRHQPGPWWHFQMHVTFLGFHIQKEINLVNAYGSHGPKRKNKIQWKGNITVSMLLVWCYPNVQKASSQWDLHTARSPLCWNPFIFYSLCTVAFGITLHQQLSVFLSAVSRHVTSLAGTMPTHLKISPPWL